MLHAWHVLERGTGPVYLRGCLARLAGPHNRWETGLILSRRTLQGPGRRHSQDRAHHKGTLRPPVANAGFSCDSHSALQGSARERQLPLNRVRVPFLERCGVRHDLFRRHGRTVDRVGHPLRHRHWCRPSRESRRAVAERRIVRSRLRLAVRHDGSHRAHGLRCDAGRSPQPSCQDSRSRLTPFAVGRIAGAARRGRASGIRGFFMRATTDIDRGDRIATCRSSQ
jgi:hypothetical protein